MDRVTLPRLGTGCRRDTSELEMKRIGSYRAIPLTKQGFLRIKATCNRKMIKMIGSTCKAPSTSGPKSLTIFLRTSPSKLLNLIWVGSTESSKNLEAKTKNSLTKTERITSGLETDTFKEPLWQSQPMILRATQCRSARPLTRNRRAIWNPLTSKWAPTPQTMPHQPTNWVWTSKKVCLQTSKTQRHYSKTAVSASSEATISRMQARSKATSKPSTKPTSSGSSPIPRTSTLDGPPKPPFDLLTFT